MQDVKSLEMLLHRMMNRIRQSLELSEILSGTVTEVRGFLGTARVKVYRFEEDGCGEVVAEAVQKKRLPSLLGQHFPAEDIPLSARELFLKARQRSIVDVSRQQIGISPLESSKISLATEDIRFRPVDSCHVEYLTAMGVQSSLVVPILHGDRLWGLLVSHHHLPRQVSAQELQVVQLVADQVSIAIAQSSLLSQTRHQMQQEATLNQVSRLLHAMPKIQLAEALEQSITALNGSGGRLYLLPHGEDLSPQLFTSGQQPLLSLKQNAQRKQVTSSTHYVAPHNGSLLTLEDYPQWQRWLNSKIVQKRQRQVWALSNLSKGTLPVALLRGFIQAKIRGVLVIRLQYRQQSLGYLSIFRHEIEIQTRWAGRPGAEDFRHLRPRQSFEVWSELKRGQSQPWQPEEIEFAQQLAHQFTTAIYQSNLYQQVSSLNTALAQDIEERKQVQLQICALNAELEERVLERTAALQYTNEKLKREIKEREQALEELQQAKDSLRRLSRQQELILNAAGEGIYGLNLQGKTTFVNPAAAKMLEYEADSLLEQPIHRIIHSTKLDGSVYPPGESPIERTLQNQTIQHSTEELFQRQDGSYFPVEFISTPIIERGRMLGAVVVFKDITERQIIERMKDEFVSVVSHELRTPLTSIRSALGLLAKGVLDHQPEKRQRMLDIAFSNTNRLVRLISDILDLERIKLGKTTLERQKCNAADLMLQAVDVMRPMADKAEVNLSVTPVNIELWVDPDRIIQTLTNLLSNAIKFSPSGSMVYVTAALIQKAQLEQILTEQSALNTMELFPIPGAQSPDSILICVQDQGRGIPHDKLETIFDRFQQIDASNAGHQGGTGLGLAICRGIVEQHGGRIWVESILGKGSVFYICLLLKSV